MLIIEWSGKLILLHSNLLIKMIASILVVAANSITYWNFSQQNTIVVEVYYILAKNISKTNADA